MKKKLINRKESIITFNKYLIFTLSFIFLYFFSDVYLYISTDIQDIVKINDILSCNIWKPFDLRVLKWVSSFVLAISIIIFMLKKRIGWYLLFFASILNSLFFINILGGYNVYITSIIDTLQILEIMSIIIFIFINRQVVMRNFEISNRQRIVYTFVSLVIIFLLDFIFKEIGLLKHDIVEGIF